MPDDLAHLAVPGTMLTVRVTPRAARTAVVADGGMIRVHVTVPPADGMANAAVQLALARALGIAKTRLRLVRGASSREKTFAID